MSGHGLLAGSPTSTARRRHGREHDVTLLELLDRLLEGGVAIDGEVTLAVADIDLVRVGLRLVVASVASLEPAGHVSDRTLAEESVAPWSTSTL